MLRVNLNIESANRQVGEELGYFIAQYSPTLPFFGQGILTNGNKIIVVMPEYNAKRHW